MSWNNLLHCGATLAAHSWRVGESCRVVLRKDGSNRAPSAPTDFVSLVA